MDTKFNNGKIQVKWLNLNRYSDEVVRLKTYLTSYEIERAYKFKFDKDRIRFIVGRALLRKMLGDILYFDPFQIKIESDNYGKLFLPNMEHRHLHFNLSHSEDYIIYAFCFNEDVGIDIEKIDPSINHFEISENYFTDIEIKYLKDSADKDTVAKKFFRIWTRKEAFLKAMGLGLLLDLKKIDVTTDTIDLSKADIKLPSDILKYWIIKDLFIQDEFGAAISYSGAIRQITISEIYD